MFLLAMGISIQVPDYGSRGRVGAETALIKLGGSVVTNKARALTLSPRNISALAGEIAHFLRGSKERRVVLVHGGGSFGHVKARKYSLAGGLKRAGQMKGFSEVRRDMRFLNARILDSLLDHGVNAVSLPPESLIDVADRAVLHEHLKLIDMSLEQSIVPVTFGDAMFDRSIAFTIISGDVLMKSLSSHLKPSVSVFCTDVDGVYDSNPRINRKARLLSTLRPATRVGSERSRRDDVTGEMSGKISVLFEIAENSGRTYVVNGLRRGRLTSALEREVSVGTEVITH